MKKAIVSILLSVLIAVLGIVMAHYWASARREAVAAEKAAVQVDKKIPNVKVQLLKAQTLEDKLTLTGTVEAWTDVRISAEIPGKIEYQGVEEGDQITAGQELFRIDTKTLQAQADQMQAQLTLANQEFERMKSLSGRGATPMRDLDAAVAGRDVASATLRSAQIALNKSVVKAPFDGVVDSTFRKRDEFIDMGAPLVRLVQVDRVKLKLGVPERDISHVKAGDKVAISVDALPNKEFIGTIYTIGPTAEETTHTFPTDIEIDNNDGQLKPGMIARATLVRHSYPDSVAIPIFSSVNLQEMRVVFLEDNGKAVIRPIQGGIVTGSLLQVTAGLKPGDRLIVVGQRDVREGEPVNVTEVIE